MSVYKGQGIVTKANSSLIYSYWIKWIINKKTKYEYE